MLNCICLWPGLPFAQFLGHSPSCQLINIVVIHLYTFSFFLLCCGNYIILLLILFFSLLCSLPLFFPPSLSSFLLFCNYLSAITYTVFPLKEMIYYMAGISKKKIQIYIFNMVQTCLSKF